MKRLLCLLLVFVCFSSQALAQGVPQVGDTVYFGRYEQDNVTENGPEPIEWMVLKVEDGKALMLTKYCIEVVIFYPERVKMYWGKSDLRAWMNSDFLNMAFSPEEQAQIVLSTIPNTNPHGMKGAGQDTEDMVFLLSKDEVLEFFPEMEDRVAFPTPYAIAREATLSSKTGSCRWWTRTSGARPMDMWGIRVDGRMTAYGMQDVDWPGNTMRPAIWVDFSK